MKDLKLDFKVTSANHLVSKIIDLARWTPLPVVVDPIVAANFVGDALYAIGENVYLSVSRFSNAKFERGENGPYITGIVWAVTEGAVRRATLLQTESDKSPDDAVAPNEFLPEQGNCSYMQILSALKSSKRKVCQETTVYRIALDGAFVHRLIETEDFKFYFRGQADDPSEFPYAVLRKLRASPTVHGS